MELVKKKLNELVLWDNNPQEMTKEMMEYLKSSIKAFGYVEPLIINDKGEVIGGNHRLQAMRELYEDGHEIDCVLVKIPYNEQKKLNISLNQIRGDFNLDILKDILQTLASQKEDITALGFDEVDLKTLDIKYDTNFEPAEPLKSIGESNRDKTALETVCPKCGHKFTPNKEYNLKGGQSFANEIG